MTTGLTYTTFTTQLATLAVVDPTDTNFLTILPQAITYAENRIYRDIDLLSTVKSTLAYSLSTGSRSITFPEGTFIVTEQVNLVSPAGSNDPNVATRIPLLPTTKEYLDAVYGDATSPGVPCYYAPFDTKTLIVGPYPSANYTVELVGTYRPDSLSATNTTTWISTYLPDLMIMAAMIYVSGYQRNFSASGNDQQMPINYETQYEALLKGADMEEYRKKYEAAAWASKSPSPVATPARG